MFAKQMCLFSVLADVESVKVAEQQSETRSSGDINQGDMTEVAESFAENLSQKIEKMPVRGMTKLYTTTKNHPISGQKMYVSVYGVSPQNIKAMKGIEAQNYETRRQQGRAAQYEKGLKGSQEQSVKNADKDQKAYQKGYQSGENQASKTKSSSSSTKSNSTKSNSPTRGASRAKSGTFQGDANVDDDF